MFSARVIYNVARMLRTKHTGLVGRVKAYFGLVILILAWGAVIQGSNRSIFVCWDAPSRDHFLHVSGGGGGHGGRPCDSAGGLEGLFPIG